LRRVTLSNAVAHLGGGIAATVATAFIYRNLHVAPVVLGVVMGLANVGAVSALCADRIARRVGMRRTLAAAHLAASAGKVALPLLAAVSPIGAILLSRVCLTAAGPLFAVNETTLRLALVPAELRGRASATVRAIVWTALPVGSLVGGVLGERIGLAATMALGAAITAAAALLLPAQRRFDAPASRHLRPKRKPRMPVPNDLSPSTI
jgi:MFS family permease